MDFKSFFSAKNPTPQRTALIAGGVVSFIFFVAGWALEKFSTHSLGILWIVSLLVGVLSYKAFLFYLKEFIDRKIKVLYKNIHRQKLAAVDKKDARANRTLQLDEVEEEVREWTEQQEAQIAQLKTWQEYRRKFLGDISHELKTPIFNIQGYLETLLDGGLEDESVNLTYLQRAAKNVERLNTIVEDLDVIAKLEAGELILDVQAFDIKALTEEVFEDLEPRAAERNIKLVFKPGADQHVQVKADREYVRQVLMNLVTNSIKYGHENGISKVSFYDMDTNVLVEVADNGIGISEEHLNHVFDRFYRVDKSRSREQGGSGLGLAIVKHILEAHKQTISVRSTPNVGSTFGFTLEKA